jgi:hypothetical protein
LWAAKHFQNLEKIWKARKSRNLGFAGPKKRLCFQRSVPAGSKFFQNFSSPNRGESKAYSRKKLAKRILDVRRAPRSGAKLPFGHHITFFYFSEDLII